MSNVNATPKRARPSLGAPSRTARVRDQSPGGVSVGSVEDVHQPNSARGDAGERALSVGAIARRPVVAGRYSRDPRPIGDRNFAAGCAYAVCDFLSERGYGKMVEPGKFLRDTSNKEFFDIFKFLVTQIDPLLKIEGPVEQEVPQIMRRLKYPTEVNKSKLQAISGPNTWPQLLAVLEWLVNLARIHKENIQPFATCQHSSTAAGEIEEDQQVLLASHENYMQFLDGKDGHEEEARLKQIYEERSSALRDEIDRLNEQFQQSEQALNDRRSEHDRLQELQREPQHLEGEANRLGKIVQAADVNVQRIEDETIALKNEEQELAVEAENLQAVVRQLNEQVQSQAHSRKDIERLISQRAYTRKAIEDLRVEIEKVDQDVFDLTMKEAKRIEDASRLQRTINDAVETVINQPLGEVAGVCDQDLHVHLDFNEPTDTLSTLDLSEERTRANEVVAAHVESAQDAQAEMQELLASMRDNDAEAEEDDRAIQHLHDRLEKLDRVRDENQTWSVAELEDAQRTLEQNEDSLAKARMGSAGPTVRDQAEVDELKLTLKAIRTSGSQERAQMQERLRNMGEKAAEHRRSVTKELTTYADDMEAFSKEILEEVKCLGPLNFSRGGG